MMAQRDAALADSERLHKALRGLTCQEDGTFSALDDDFPDGGEIVLCWPGNRQSWEDARVAIEQHQEATK